MSDYQALKAYGFSPAKAAEIELDANRGDAHAKAFLDLARAAALKQIENKPARREERHVNEWQPIETAPKDGSSIFVWGALEIAQLPSVRVGCNGRYEVYWTGSSWRSYLYGGYVNNPICWMPLPEPPKMEDWS